MYMQCSITLLKILQISFLGSCWYEWLKNVFPSSKVCDQKILSFHCFDNLKCILTGYFLFALLTFHVRSRRTNKVIGCKQLQRP